MTTSPTRPRKSASVRVADTSRSKIAVEENKVTTVTTTSFAPNRANRRRTGTNLAAQIAAPAPKTHTRRASLKMLPVITAFGGCRSIPASQTYPPCKYTPQLHQAQKSLIGALKPIPVEPLPLMSTVPEILDRIPSEHRGMQESLSRIVKANDVFGLVALAPKLLALYNAVKEIIEVSSVILQLLFFVAQFPACEFSPRDCALEAYKIAPTLPAAIAPTLLAISRVTATDFIDKELAQSIDSVLQGSSNIDVQRVRWMYHNIVRTQLVDDHNMDPAIERTIELPEEDLARKPVTALTLPEIIKAGRRCSHKVAGFLKEKLRPTGWPDDFDIDAIQKYFTDMEKQFADIKVVQQAHWYTEVIKVLKVIIPLVQDWRPDDTKYVSRLHDQFVCLETYCSYLNSQGKFTVNSVIRCLRDADEALVAQEAGDNPMTVVRIAWVRAAIAKVSSSVLHPFTTERMLSAISPILLALQKEVDSPEASLHLLIAEWIVRTQDLIRLPTVVALGDLAHILRIVSLEISAKGQGVQDQNASAYARQWTEKLKTRAADVDTIADGSDPTAVSNAEKILALRKEIERATRRLPDFGLENEMAAVSSAIETVLGGMQSPVLRRRLLRESSEVEVSAPVARVSFIPDQKALVKDTEVDYSLLPVPIDHPVYDAWDLERFKEAVRPTQAIPIDIQMLQKVTTAKLGGRQRMAAARAKVGEASNVGIRALSLTPGKPRTGSSNEVSRAVELLKKLSAEIDIIAQNPSLAAQLDWIEKAFPVLQVPISLTDPSVVQLSGPFSKKYNDLINAIDVPVVVLPRPAIVILQQRAADLVTILTLYHDQGIGSDDETILKAMEAWTLYLTDAVRILTLIQKADDEVAIYSAKDFFIAFRGSLLSFAHPAETIDQKAQRKALGVIRSVVTAVIQVIFNFNSAIRSSDLCSITDAQTQLDELSKEFDDAQGLANQKALFSAISGEITQVLEAPDVNNSTADDAAQRLKVVHESLEPDIHDQKDESYNLFMSTVSLRISLRNLHVSDASPDQVLYQLANTTSSDLFQVINVLSAALNSGEQQVRDFAQAWVTHLDKCRSDVEGIQNSAALVSSSPTRRAPMSTNVSDIRRSLLPIEDAKFPLPVAPYGRLVHHLERLDSYLKSSPEKSRRFRRNDEDDALSSQMSFLTSSIGSSPSGVISPESRALETFADGFLKIDVHALQAQVTDNLARFPTRTTIAFKVSSCLGDLFNAHTEAFTRNHSISSRSTRVCFALISEYCLSIVECATKSALALKSNEIDDLQAAVNKHGTAIQQIQEDYSDKTTFSEFGHCRLLIFANVCCMLAQVCTLNIFHLAPQHLLFGFDELKSYVPEILKIFRQFPTQYPALDVFEMVQTIEDLSTTITFDEAPDRIVRFLQTESKFCGALLDLMRLLMDQPDLRLWKLTGVGLELSSPIIEELPGGTEIPHAGQLKRGLLTLNEQLVEFGSVLAASEVNEETLSAQTGALDHSNLVLCQNALAIPSDSGFKQLVHVFRDQTVRFVNRLKEDLYYGTYVLFSPAVEELLNDSKSTVIQLIRHLGIMQQIEEDVDMGTLLSRLIKLLYLARDEVVAIAKRQQSPTVLVLAQLTGNAYNTIGQILMTIKNAGPKIERILRTEKVNILRQLLFAVQSVLNAATLFESLLDNLSNDPVESPEFLFKANYEPVLVALKLVKKSIPPFIPNAARLSHAMGSIILDISIAVEPRCEERPMVGITG